ncbi:HAMP domain-containing protein [Nocardia panacis]|uniref:histidine kinase n=1 Tax=Nocardia panacis TaxID=2340916 RepID=A0A3A4K7L9_9NOCA|nr:ATP-binding protein [Nocardia panacis]RJO77159.1 HAMP domain-containing protein [Nocardia panacis]
MEAAPRSWQLSLSNWSVTRKVGIVLVLPVLLATVFAVLRINNELRVMSQLDIATEQAGIVRPIVKFNTAAEQLAVTATASWGNTADPQTDTALGKFDQSLADLETAIRNTRLSAKANQELASAIATGTTMRNSLRNGSPAMVGEQADEIAARAGNALALSPAVDDLTVQRYFLQLGAIQTARRTLTQQRLLIGSPGAGSNPSVRPRVLTAAGAEMTVIGTYSMIQPENSNYLRPLMDAVQIRLAAFSQNIGDPTANPAVLESLQTSADTYDKTTDQLTGLIDKALAESTSEAQGTALRETAVVIGMLLAGLALALAVARTLVVPVRRLRRDALEVAHVKLPEELEVVRAGGTTPQIEPVAVGGADEIGQLARAVDEMHERALNLAAEQARLRLQIGSMFETLSRRSQSLVEQQLALIEDLERDEDNTDRLQTLFRLDHLATRMRRNGDNLLVLAGTALRRGQLQPVRLSDMLWSAVSQVEDYQRVEIGAVPDGIVSGEPAVDIEHLLAELIDNALRYSPPTTPVAVTVARAVDGGYLIEITDRGLGMAEDDLHTTNERLASGGEVTVETARRMGLYVVGRLAKRHSITVGLRRTSNTVQQSGITAGVHLPGVLVATQLAEADHPTGILPPVLIDTPRPEAAGSDSVSGTQPRTLVPVPNLPSSGPVPLASGPIPIVTPTGATVSGGAAPLADVSGPVPIGTTPSGTLSLSGSGPVPIGTTPSGTVPLSGSEPEKTGSATTSESNWSIPIGGGAASAGPVPASPLASIPGIGATRSGSEPTNSPASGSIPVVTGPPRPDSDATPSHGGEPGRDEAPFGRTSSGLPQRRPARSAETSGSPTSFAASDADPMPTDVWAEITDEQPTGPPLYRARPETQSSEPISPRPVPTLNRGPGSEPDDPTQPTTGTRLQPVAGSSPTPIYQRMVSEWLVEPAATQRPADTWRSPADAGWIAAADASHPTATGRTVGGLPIRKPGAQLVPGGVDQAAPSGSIRDPEEIRNNLTRHLSGVRSGRASAQYNDGGHA